MQYKCVMLETVPIEGGLSQLEAEATRLVNEELERSADWKLLNVVFHKKGDSHICDIAVHFTKADE